MAMISTPVSRAWKPVRSLMPNGAARRRVFFIAWWMTLSGCAVAALAGDGPACTLIPLHTGVCRLGADHVLGPDHSAAERMAFAIYAFLVEGAGGERALVDLGPATTDYLNQMFRRYGFFRDLGPGIAPDQRFPDDIVQPEGNVFDHLRRLGVPPQEVRHIVLTHLHADHHGMDDARGGGAAERFPNATLHISAVGWKDNLDKRQDGRWNSYVDFAFSDFLVARQEAGKLRLEDDATVFPGLRTMYLGGHSICSQAVLVNTADGLVILASDDVYLYRLLADNVLPRIHTSEAGYRAAVGRLVQLAVQENAIIIPLHDPVVWETYQRAGAGWLRKLREISDQAVQGYLTTVKNQPP